MEIVTQVQPTWEQPEPEPIQEPKKKKSLWFNIMRAILAGPFLLSIGLLAGFGYGFYVGFTAVFKLAYFARTGDKEEIKKYMAGMQAFKHQANQKRKK